MKLWQRMGAAMGDFLHREWMLEATLVVTVTALTGVLVFLSW